ncbi:molybdopterin-dependent oxidoreductase [Paenibacillus hamazuiensis]|uniref:molybdopterin-dependent oxidoreductase n=1 Tax=Paenibacillus hamazuiensis TaxID=2936508 RepID=UPI00200F2DE0|nr:molybdopterin-dependent oxidoreductase [Paenibacillus hamazuiensis]
MEKRSWLKQPYGKKLAKLHGWNAWIVLLLAVTGIILWIPSIRGDLGVIRVILKWLHIALGIASIVLIGLYMPLIPKHWKQLRDKLAQRWNLAVVLALLAGWSLSGIVLWQFRQLPPAWSNAALTLHDLFTWVGLPYAAYHSISRSRWVKEARRQELLELRSREAASSGSAGRDVAHDGGDNGKENAAASVIRALKNAPISRATFIRTVIGLLLVFGIGPKFYRWLRGAFESAGTDIAAMAEGDRNRMLPAPEPSPDSANVIGGGLQGDFRIYTVTEYPEFTSESWKFAISGLVAEPQAWNWEQFLKLKRKVQVSDFHCVTGWSVYKITWEGIPLRALLDLVKVKQNARFVKMYSGDKVYTDCLSLEQARMDDVMVAVLMDGKPIPQLLGGPVRLVVPKMYAYKSVKWLQAIELTDKEHFGYWEVRGYDNDAWVPLGKDGRPV